MQYPDYNEHILHGTPDRPIACYYVDEKHPRYHMPLHWHIECEIVRVRTGSICLSIDDTRVTAEEGDLVFIGRGAIHGGEPTGCVYECAVFDASLLDSAPCRQAVTQLIGRSIHVRRAMTPNGSDFTHLADQLFEYTRDPSDARLLMAVGSLFALYGLLSSPQSGTPVQPAPASSRQRAEQLKPALEYIDLHYGQRITLDELARLTGLSPKYFCRAFRAIVRRSPIDYLNFHRVECASALLSSSELTIAEVAYHCGFNDSSFFIKQFRRYKGKTPGQYREENRRGQ